MMMATQTCAPGIAAISQVRNGEKKVWPTWAPFQDTHVHTAVETYNLSRTESKLLVSYDQ